MAGEHRLRELEPVVEQHRDAVAGTNAARGERSRDPGRPRVELGVRALDAGEDERDAIRVLGGTATQERRQGAHVVRTVHALTPGAP